MFHITSRKSSGKCSTGCGTFTTRRLPKTKPCALDSLAKLYKIVLKWRIEKCKPARPERDRAKTVVASRSREYFGNQLSHAEAVDLSRQNPHRQNSGWPSSRSRKRNRPPHTQETRARRYRIPSRHLSQDQRPQPTDRPRGGHKVQRPAGASDLGHRRTAHHVHHHRRCRERDAPQGRRARSCSDQVH